jgi:DNA-binding NtrC family response regulator
MQNPGTVVVLGALPVDHSVFDHVAAEFGWTVRSAAALAELNADQNLAVVLFSPRHMALPWEQALQAVLEAAPRALPILCHTFAETLDWPKAANAGAFHSLLLPFDAREVRQSLGFAWSAKLRSATILKPRRPRLHRIIRRPNRAVPAQLLAPPA